MSIYQIGDDEKIFQLPLIWGSYKKSYVFQENYISITDFSRENAYLKKDMDKKAMSFI